MTTTPFPIRYARNLDTGQVGRDTGFGLGARICVDGVWHDRARWVEASFDEWQSYRAAR